MSLRPRRRNIVVWNQSASSAGRYAVLPFTQFTGTRLIRAAVRAGELLLVIVLMRLDRALETRWRTMLAGAVLTVTGAILRGGPGGLVLLPGLMFLLYGPFMPGDPDAGGKRRTLKRELAAYTTPAQRRDLEATLDRYPDKTTSEIRDILHNLAMAAYNNQLAGPPQYRR